MRALLTAIVACCGLALGASAQETDEERQRIELVVWQLALELSAACPIANPADQLALDTCRHALFRGSLLRRSLSTFLLWGRPHPTPGESLKNTTLTQLAPEVWTGLYAPLFMFDGSWRVDYDVGEQLYRARLGVRFRKALPPGQYAYPFWHNAKKWSDYQIADTLVLWLAAQPSPLIRVAQFSNDGQGAASEPAAWPFDGQWMWTDASGNAQPAPALFLGLFSAENPYLRQLEPSYRDLAGAMRKAHCNDCHVPENPNRMKRLVLLQTPAHAASEIGRLMKSVRDNDMPVDDTLLYREIDADTKQMLLREGAAFEALVDAARAWEEGRARSP